MCTGAGVRAAVPVPKKRELRRFSFSSLFLICSLGLFAPVSSPEEAFGVDISSLSDHKDVASS